MEKRWLLALLVPLTSCTLAPPEIRARLVDGVVVFDAFASSGWFGSLEPVDHAIDRFSVFSRDGAVWVIERDRAAGCAWAPGRTDFPLTYGRLPKCFNERLAARPLQPGVIYQIATSEDRGSSGGFKIDGKSIANFDRGENAKLAGWPLENHPNSTYPQEYLDMNSAEANAVETPSG